MSDFDRALLEEFAAEILEHVTACEQVLVRASTEAVSEDDLQAIFRSVHSIKGLARVLASTGLERLAHAAESLLSVAREVRALEGPAQNVLLRAVDAFKTARARLLEGADFEEDEALVQALAGTDPRARADSDGSAPSDPRGPAPDADPSFDPDTLVALAEVFEEILPSIAAATATGEAPVAGVLDDIGALAFALDKLGLTALQHAVAALRDRGRPVAFARCLHLVERLGHLTERDCGLFEAVRLSSPWLAPAMLAAFEEGRSSDGTWILRALSPRSPFLGLLPQLANDGCSPEMRRIARGAILQALRSEFGAGLPSSADGAALAAENIQELLAKPHRLPPAVLSTLDARRLDLERFRAPPAATAARLHAFAAEPSRQMFELLLRAADSGELSALAWALNRSLDPLLGETAVVQGGPALALLFTSDESEEQLRARIGSLVAAAVPTLRKLDHQPGDAHFRVKARPVGEPPSAETQVRVPVALLDSMFGRIGQFFGVTTRFNALVFDSDVRDILGQLSDYAVLHAPSLLPKIDRLVRHQNEYATLEAEAHRLISVIHEMTLGLRVIPMDTLFSRFPRVVRDLSQKQGKPVRLDAQSNGIRVDNGMLELLADPLLHMLRNCIDHGIEPPDDREKAGKPRTATLTLHAEQRGNHVHLEVGDDGRGIDLERVLERAIGRGLIDAATAATLTEEQVARFIFSPGFSTAARVTATSGRGVGMDIALVNVTKLGGVIDIVTHRGRGTSFRVDIPLSKAIQPVLLAETGVQTVAFPDRMVVECHVAPAGDVQSVNGQRSILLHGRFLPLFGLVDLLQLPAPPRQSRTDDLSVVVCELDGRRAGFEVHRIRRRTDLLVQEMHPRIAKLPGIGGISTLGTDKIVVAVDPEGLFDLARRFAVFGLRTHAVRVAEGMF